MGSTHSTAMVTRAYRCPIRGLMELPRLSNVGVKYMHHRESQVATKFLLRTLPLVITAIELV